MSIAYISGHLDLTCGEFAEHYGILLKDAILQNHEFVVGDARGTDLLAQACLAEFTNKVTVYHMFDSPRNNVGHFKTVGGFETDDARDAAMTNASDYDIAWVRPGREKSGTAKNIKRRQTMLKA
jgi:hypothetical protein